MATLTERWLERDTLAVLELDDPRFHAPHPDHGDPRARLRFYGACGVRLLDIPFLQPRLRPGLPRGHPMFLGVIPPTGATLPERIPSGPIGAFPRQYFEDCEASTVNDDAEFLRLMNACREPEIELVSTANFASIPERR